ncbi:MAG: VWA domain-containing protein [Planctomycetales bacterium]|nr:VWA domain-containing protein [Planctomycetales bacterium]
MTSPRPNSNPDEQRNPRSWRGREEQATGRAQYRWQKGGGAIAHGASRGRGSRGTLAFVIVSFAFLGLIAALIFFVLQTPRRTPVIVITSESYRAPLPPLQWIREDVQGFAELDRQNIDLYHVRWDGNVQSGLDQLRDVLTKVAGDNPHAVMIYVGMHTGVDANGTPCLIPVSGHAHEESTWLPVASLLDTISGNQVTANRPTFVIFDTNRVGVDWRCGEICNTFSERLTTLIDAHSNTQLAVLCAASSGEVAWSSPQLCQSVFAHFLQLGIAGAADEVEVGGNGDHHVSSRELRQYVADQVSHWSVSNRAATQTVSSCGQNNNMPLVAALNPRAVATLQRARLAKAGAATYALSPHAIEAKWHQLQTLSEKSDLLRLEPRRYAALQQSLVRSELLSRAGEAYQAELQRELEAWEVTTSEMLQKSVVHESLAGSLVQRWKDISENALVIPCPPLHDCSTAILMGSIDLHTNSMVHDTILKSAEGTTVDALSQISDEVKSNLRGGVWEESYFLELLARYRVPQRWSNPSVVRQILETRNAVGRRVLPAGTTADKLVGDERAQFWIRALVERADGQLRAAQDLLIAGPDVGVEAVTSRCRDAQATYESVERQLQRIAEAYRLRDEIAAELPHYIQWFASPHQLYAAQDSSLQYADSAYVFYQNAVMPTQQNAAQLTHLLDVASVGHVQQEQVWQRIEVLVDNLKSHDSNVAGSWHNLQASMEKLIEAMLADELSPAILRQIELLLQYPVLSASARGQLVSKWQQGTTEIHAAYCTADGTRYHQRRPGISPSPAVDGGVTDALNAEGRQTIAGAFAGWWISQATAPSQLMTLSIADSEVSYGDEKSTSGHPLRTLEQDAAGLRRTLRIPPDLTDALAASDVDVARSSFARAATRCRAVSTVAADALWSHPLELYRRFELQQLLLWQASRAMQDQWGPSPGTTVPFFVLAAKDYVTAANSMLPLFDLRDRIREIDRRQELVEGWLTLHPESPGMTRSDAEQLDVHVRVSGQSADNPQDGLAENERGFASILLRGNEALQDTLRLTRDGAGPDALNVWPMSEREGSLRLAGNVDADLANSLDVVLAFRGFEYLQSLMCHDGNAIETDVTTVDASSSRVTVVADHTSFGNIVFVLDGSNSMSHPNAAEPSRSNMDVAKEAVNELLLAMLEEGTLRCGMTVYGHRLGFGQLSGDVKVQSMYAGKIPAGIRPTNDIENVMPLGPFTELSLQRLNQAITGVSGYGQSPHYGATVAALNELATDGAGGAESVILVTDGGQFHDDANELQDQDEVSWDQYLRELKQQDIPVYFLLVGKPNSSDMQAIQQVATVSGGGVFDDSSVAAMVAALQAASRSMVFHLTTGNEPSSDDANRGESETVRFGDWLKLPVEPTAGCVNCTVRVADSEQQIVMRGGETVALQYQTDSGFLVVPSFRRPLSQFLEVRRTRADGGMNPTCFVHRPVHVDGEAEDDIEFVVSWQDLRDQYVQWPAALWVEITPVSSDLTAHATRYFWDPNFDSSAAVPAQRCLARTWPKNAQRAEVRAWYAPQLPEATLQKQFVELGLVEPMEFTGTVAVADNVNLDVVSHVDSASGDFVMTVSQLTVGKPCEPLRVDVTIGNQFVPLRIVRRFDDARGLCSHTFIIPAARAAEVVQDAQIRVTPRSSFLQQSWGLDGDGFMVVNVPTPSDVLRQPQATARKQ